MAVTKTSQQVTDLVNGFGGANFADILNRLWMNGIPIADLQKALATTSNGTNEPADIVARLLNSGVASIDQIRAAPTSYVPPDPQSIAWPFRPESKNAQGVVVPTNTAAAPPHSNEFGIVNPKEPSPYIYRGTLNPVAPPPSASIPTGTTPISPGSKTPGSGTTVTNTTLPPPPKEEKAPVTDQEIRDYEAQHFGSMLWVNSNPTLSKLMRDAATGKWTPEKFTAELHNTEWWKTTSDTTRAYTQMQAEDPAKFQQQLGTHTNLVKMTASNLGITLSDADAENLANNWMKLGWSDTEAKQAIVGQAKYDPNQAGGLGAYETKAKAFGKQYLVNMSDEEAFSWAQKLATGEVTDANITESLAARAKGAYPSIADFIEKGGVPQNYFNQHLSTAAQLLEVDPSSIDLTDPKYSDIVNHADDKGNIRPMTVYETSKFIKSKDEYWKTSNSGNEVASLVNTLGQAFGKVGM